MTLAALIEQYTACQKRIKENRKIINALIDSNKKDQKKVKQIHEQIKDQLKEEFAAGNNIYQISKREFGVIDWRFHKLYSFVRGRVKSKREYKI